MLCCPQYKSQTYFQKERTKLSKRNPTGIQLEILFKENMKILITTLTISIYSKISEN